MPTKEEEKKTRTTCMGQSCFLCSFSFSLVCFMTASVISAHIDCVAGRNGLCIGTPGFSLYTHIYNRRFDDAHRRKRKKKLNVYCRYRKTTNSYSHVFYLFGRTESGFCVLLFNARCYFAQTDPRFFSFQNTCAHTSLFFRASRKMI